MDPFPPDLLAVLPDGAGPVAERGWAPLTDAERGRIAGRWDERIEVCFAPIPLRAQAPSPIVEGERPGGHRDAPEHMPSHA